MWNKEREIRETRRCIDRKREQYERDGERQTDRKRMKKRFR